MTKICNRCKTEKPRTEFSSYLKAKDGLWAHCKACCRELDQLRRAKNKERNKDGIFSDPNVLKRCPDCVTEKPLPDFYKSRPSKDGHDSICKSCRAVRVVETSERRKSRWQPVTEGVKTCTQCKTEKHVLEFSVHRGTADGLRYTCKACDSAAYQSLRISAFWHYCDGELPSCRCCGVTQHEFLGIDHINGGGNKHRHEIGNLPIYVWLKRENYPPGFRVLCHNCNQAIGYYGYCPHEREREERRKALEGAV